MTDHHRALDTMLLDLCRRIDRMCDRAYNAIVMEVFSARLSIKWIHE